jgi:predicted membrane-bound spermidine synthase
MGLLESALEFAGRLNPVQAIAMFPLLVSILLLLAWLKARPETGIESALTVLTVAVAGFTAMEVTMSMIYLCQILFGALFYQVAMISSTFMLALAGGSWWSSRRAPTERALSSGIANLLFALGAAAFAPALIAQFAEILGSMPSTWTSVAVYAAFYTGLLLTGLLCGALFPWAAEVYHRSRRSAELGATAACLDAADHVGASLAAVVAGSVMIPALGLKTTGLGAGLMVVCVALFWSALAVRR